MPSVPNGGDWLEPGEWSRLNAPLVEIDPLISEFAERHGAHVAVGGTLAGLPSRVVHAGEHPIRTLEVRPHPDLHDPAYDIWIRASVGDGWNPLQKQRGAAERIAAEDLAKTFAEVAEEGWRELAGWSPDDGWAPRW